MKTTPECCGNWPRYWLSFQWFTIEDDAFLIMPYLGNQVRINYCPSCGADVRDCIVGRERFREAMPEQFRPEDAR